MIHHSASQFSAFSPDYGGCNRKWAFSYIENYPRIETPGQTKGKQVHTALEQWLRDKIPLPDNEIGRIARAGLKYLPLPSPYLMVESKWLLDWDGVEIVMYIDLIDPLGEMNPGLITISDHKSTKDLKYKKLPEVLREDPQGILYPLAVFQHKAFIDHNEIALRWNYFRTQGAPKCEPVNLIVTRSEVFARSEKLVALSKNMATIQNSGIKSALELEPNPKVCEAYGGCQFRDVCKLSPAQKLGAIMANESFMDKISKTANAKAAAQAAGDAVKVVDAKLDGHSGVLAALQAKVKAPGPMTPKGVSLEAAKLPPSASPAVTSGLAIPEVFPAFSLATGINPPDAAKSVAELPPEATKVKAPRKSKAVDTAAIVNSWPATGFTLCVSCLPSKGTPYVHLTDILGPLAKEVARENGLNDFRLIEYGKGVPMLASKFTDWLDLNDLTGVIVADKFSDMSKAALDILFQRAAVVFEAVR